MTAFTGAQDLNRHDPLALVHPCPSLPSRPPRAFLAPGRSPWRPRCCVGPWSAWRQQLRTRAWAGPCTAVAGQGHAPWDHGQWAQPETHTAAAFRLFFEGPGPPSLPPPPPPPTDFPQQPDMSLSPAASRSWTPTGMGWRTRQTSAPGPPGSSPCGPSAVWDAIGARWDPRSTSRLMAHTPAILASSHVLCSCLGGLL
jgi:hypothetical protein